MSKVRVKICGLTEPEQAQVAVDAGADAIGLVFYPPSPRHVEDLGMAREIAAAAGPFVTVVALVVNQEASFIENLLENVPINLLQFHGDESEQECLAYATPYIKAIRMKDDLDVLAAINAFPRAQGVLLDTYCKGKPGGTGESFNWERVPAPASKPIILAGGLTPDNVAQAIAVAKPYGVDVSGGVESAPGIKDLVKIRQFVQNAKAKAVN